MLELGRCFNWIKICPFQVETVETGSKSEKPGGSGRCPGGEGQEKNAPEIEPSDTNSDNCDETLVGISIAEPGHKIESSAARPQAQNSSAEVSRKARKPTRTRKGHNFGLQRWSSNLPTHLQAEKRRNKEELSAISTKPASANAQELEVLDHHHKITLKGFLRL